jgi:type IV pilus assembly protein PilP
MILQHCGLRMLWWQVTLVATAALNWAGPGSAQLFLQPVQVAQVNPTPGGDPGAQLQAAFTAGIGSEGVSNGGIGGYTYDPSGRRDPFAAIVLPGQVSGEPDLSVPPLQRVGLTELNLIGIVWGAYGYVAMVQTPDGKGYTVRRGTHIGPNHGVVSGISENAIIVQERFTDVYGKRQEREYVKLLHTKENSE